MTLILSGTDGLSDIDGSAATPAIRGTDTNTGIFFPAADTIAFSEGGVEAMRIDSSGNVGIGTSSPGAKLEVARTDSAAGIRVTVGQGSYSGNVALFGVTGQSNGYYITKDAVNNIAHIWDGTGGLERMRIDSGGNLLVGTTSPPSFATSRLVVAYGTADYAFALVNSNASPYGMVIGYTGASPNNTSNAFFYCQDSGPTQRFSVRANGGVYNYSANDVNLSDRREKTNFAPAKSYLDTICAIPVQTFNYIDQNMEEDPGKTLGVVAQDVQAVAPELVMESNWGTKDDPKMRLSVYQTDLQYALMKCIQEQQAIIQSLTARIEALEGK